MIKDNFRLGQFILFAISLFVLAASLYFQFVKKLEPCPLCLMQRFCVIIALVLCMAGMFCKTVSARRRVLIFQLVIGIAGIYFSGRQLWLQTLPADQLPACLPGMNVLLQYFPWKDILHAMFLGAADCGEINWQWLGLSMPAWSALYFATFVVVVLISNLQVRRAWAHS